MKVWLWILQAAPIAAPRWISTKVPIRVRSPIRTAVEVGERVDVDALAEGDVVEQTLRRLVDRSAVGRPVRHPAINAADPARLCAKRAIAQTFAPLAPLMIRGGSQRADRATSRRASGQLCVVAGADAADRAAADRRGAGEHKPDAHTAARRSTPRRSSSTASSTRPRSSSSPATSTGRARWRPCAACAARSREPAIVAVSPTATATGVRRALDAGADAIVFEPELESTLAVAVSAVGSRPVGGPAQAARQRRATGLLAPRAPGPHLRLAGADQRPDRRASSSSPRARSRATSPPPSPSSACARAARPPRSSSSSNRRNGACQAEAGLIAPTPRRSDVSTATAADRPARWPRPRARGFPSSASTAPTPSSSPS